MRFILQPIGASLQALALAILVFSASAGSKVTLQKEASPSELLVIVKDGKYGYIDHQGHIVIRPQFIWANDFWQGLAPVFVCGRLVSIDPAGNIHPFRVALPGELVPRRVGEKTGFIDAQGQFKIPAIFDDAHDFSEGFAAVQVGDKWGFIDREGHQVIAPQFSGAYYFREGVAAVDVTDAISGEEEWGIIDKTGNVIARGLEMIGFVNEGRMRAQHNQKWGYLDLQGKTVIPFVYEMTDGFFRGLAAVQIGDKWGYIGRDGHVAIPFEFDDAGPFASGLAPVKRGKETGFIDESGKFAFHLEFENASGFIAANEENLSIGGGDVSSFWTADGLFGYVNTSGKVIWGPTAESRDHWPLLGWSKKEIAKSCEGVPESVRKAIAGFPHH
jgi:hypothetical protein